MGKRPVLSSDVMKRTGSSMFVEETLASFRIGNTWKTILFFLPSYFEHVLRIYPWHMWENHHLPVLSSWMWCLLLSLLHCCYAVDEKQTADDSTWKTSTPQLDIPLHIWTAKMQTCRKDSTSSYCFLITEVKYSLRKAFWDRLLTTMGKREESGIIPYRREAQSLGIVPCVDGSDTSTQSVRACTRLPRSPPRGHGLWPRSTWDCIRTLVFYQGDCKTFPANFLQANSCKIRHFSLLCFTNLSHRLFIVKIIKPNTVHSCLLPILIISSALSITIVCNFEALLQCYHTELLLCSWVRAVFLANAIERKSGTYAVMKTFNFEKIDFLPPRKSSTTKEQGSS